MKKVLFLLILLMSCENQFNDNKESQSQLNDLKSSVETDSDSENLDNNSGKKATSTEYLLQCNDVNAPVRTIKITNSNSPFSTGFEFKLDESMYLYGIYVSTIVYDDEGAVAGAYGSLKNRNIEFPIRNQDPFIKEFSDKNFIKHQVHHVADLSKQISWTRANSVYRVFLTDENSNKYSFALEKEW